MSITAWAGKVYACGSRFHGFGGLDEAGHASVSITAWDGKVYACGSRLHGFRGLDEASHGDVHTTVWDGKMHNATSGSAFIDKQVTGYRVR